MIEVEKKFVLKEGDKDRLTADADFISKKIIRDAYYDTAGHALTGKDYWLRKRDGRFELKASLNKDPVGERKADRYRELETDKEIAIELGIELRGDLEDVLEASDYQPFCRFITTREKYKMGKFTLDFDSTDFGFTIFEVELLVETQDDILEAEEEIFKFARDHQIDEDSRSGKVVEYLRRNNPEHIAYLVKQGIVSG